ncbi:MAG: hypothetical protein E6G60_19510 [Actinobacteria bacterium]|nr:MAG: hypothetical protein E6G60_19510 [Actinomycetota bacterium]
MPRRRVSGDPAAMRRPLGLLRPGTYTVRWISVSSDDGHREEGSYTFAVATGTAAMTRLTSAGPLSTDGPVGTFASFLVLFGVALWAGLVVLRETARRGGAPERRVARLVRLAPALVVTGSLLAVVSLIDPSSLSRSVAAVAGGRVGVVRFVVLGAAAGAVVAHARLLVYTASAVVALVAQVASGHVTATASPLVASVVLMVHLAAAGVWVAAIVLALLSARLVATLRVLSPYAVAAAAAVVATGIVSAAFEVASPVELVRSGYGIVLLAKLTAVILIGAFGAWHWLARRTRRPSRPVRLALRLEAVAAGIALLLGTVLVGSAPPASAASRRVALPASAAALVERNIVSVAGASGPFVVAFTITPPRPGPIRVQLQVLGSTTSERVRSVVLDGSARDGTGFEVPLRPAHPDLYVGSARTDRAATWTLRASLDTDHGTIRVSVAVPLPAPSGIAELDRAIEAQQRLVSARVHETLQSTERSPLLVTDYRFHAPDTFGFSTPSSDEVDIGARSYRRDAAASRWRAGDTGFPFRWPTPYFRQLWGRDVVDGVPTHVVAFSRPDLPAWFELWVGDRDGLVRREQMLAEAHLMEHTYSDFDRVPSLAPPR